MKLRDKLGNLLDRTHRRDSGLRIDVSNLSGSTADGITPSPSRNRSGRFSKTPRRLSKTPRAKSVGPWGGWSSPSGRSSASNAFGMSADVSAENESAVTDLPNQLPPQSRRQSSPVTPEDTSSQPSSLSEEKKPRSLKHITAPAWEPPGQNSSSKAAPSNLSPRLGIPATSLRRKKPPPIVANVPPGGGPPLDDVQVPKEKRSGESGADVMPLVRVHSDKQPQVKSIVTTRIPGNRAPHAKKEENTAEIEEEGSSSDQDFSFSSDWTDSGFSEVQEKTQSPPKQTKRRPPGLRNMELGPEREEQQIFGEDGALHANGFTISNKGILSDPIGLQRQKSNGSSIEGVPRSIRSVVTVRSLDELRVTKSIGAGASGRVNLSIHIPSGQQMAVKVVNVYDEAKRNQLLKELETLTTYVSRFLVRFYGAFYDGKGAVHIILEFMDCGALADLISNYGPIPEGVTNHIAVNCLHGLKFLHQSRVLHRDLKTANVLLSREMGRAKLSDFGLAREVNAGVSNADTFVGTLAYMSPERLHGSPYTYASDVWGLGVSIAECLLGRYPFDKPQSYFDYIAVTTTTENLLPRGEFSPACEDFVRRCTAVDPRKRPDCDELLNHRWIRESQRDGAVFARWLDDITAARYTTGLNKERK